MDEKLLNAIAEDQMGWYLKGQLDMINSVIDGTETFLDRGKQVTAKSMLTTLRLLRDVVANWTISDIERLANIPVEDRLADAHAAVENAFNRNQTKN